VLALPLADEQAVAEARSTSQQSIESKKGVRVLVVDDNKDSAIGLTKLLTLCGDMR
jgi:D-alanine-D-alanine ligase-like ATP-grasp enzyme